MDENSNYHLAIEKIKKGEHFGLFEDGRRCYFQDGVKVSYTDLWIALRDVRNLKQGNHGRTLAELCSDTFGQTEVEEKGCNKTVAIS